LLIAEIVLLTDMAKQTIIYVKYCADWFVCLSVFLFIAFDNFCWLNLFMYVVEVT